MQRCPPGFLSEERQPPTFAPKLGVRKRQPPIFVTIIRSPQKNLESQENLNKYRYFGIINRLNRINIARNFYV